MGYKYEDQCGSCLNFKDMENDDILFSGGEYTYGHCIRLRDCYRPYSDKCSYYINKYGCHIVTAICELLDEPEKGSILEELRNFRANVLEKDPKYKKTLADYDIVGPQIADYIREDEDKETAGHLFAFGVIPTVELVRNHKYDEAVNTYKKMTKFLIDIYNIEGLEIDRPKQKTLGTRG